MHALWDMFTKIEKAILIRKSQKEWITDHIKKNYPKDQWVEEGIAHAISRWHAGECMDGVVAKAFKKFMAIARAIGSVFTNNRVSARPKRSIGSNIGAKALSPNDRRRLAARVVKEALRMQIKVKSAPTLWQIVKIIQLVSCCTRPLA